MGWLVVIGLVLVVWSAFIRDGREGGNRYRYELEAEREQRRRVLLAGVIRRA